MAVIGSKLLHLSQQLCIDSVLSSLRICSQAISLRTSELLSAWSQPETKRFGGATSIMKFDEGGFLDCGEEIGGKPMLSVRV
jgi:hypothetical protein